MNNPFRKEDLQDLQLFIDKYDSIHASIKNLEGILQSVLAEQKKCVDDLDLVRKDEEAFFEEISAREGLPVLDLKKLATSWAMMKKNENFIS